MIEIISTSKRDALGRGYPLFGGSTVWRDPCYRLAIEEAAPFYTWDLFNFVTFLKKAVEHSVNIRNGCVF